MRAVEFWSSTEYSSFQQGLVRALTAAGWCASHRFELPQHEYWDARSRVQRLAMRARCYGLYPAKVAARFARSAPGMVGVVCSNTFFAPGVAEMAARRQGTPIIHWVFDLYPEVLVRAGKLRAGAAVERALRVLVRRMLDRAHANVFLGQRLLAHAERQFGEIPRSVVIPVGCDAAPFRQSAPVLHGTPVRVLYCGNMGRMHEVATVIEALRAGVPEGIDIAFRGNGVGFYELEKAIQEHHLQARVQMGSNLPESEWLERMRRTDVAIVSLRRGAEGLVMPSKTYSAMAAGQAVLAICPGDSDLAETIHKHDCGWIVEPGDSRGITQALEMALRDPGELLRRRTNAWRAGHEVYDQTVIARSWIDLLQSVSYQAR